MLTNANIDKAQNDWIGSSSIFYNEKTNMISSCIWDVIDCSDFSIDKEALSDYLEFGYSVFGHTIIKNVKFLMPNESIQKKSGGIEVSKIPDPVEKSIHHSTTAKDTMEYMEYVINTMASRINAPIILPLSGGFDSRLIAFFLKHKSVHCFTYGISKEQNQSYEVINAKAIASKLGFKWNQINLGKYHQYIDEWLKVYGASVHAHGMYHMEFYNIIKQEYIPAGAVFSGIVGDAWAGSIKIPAIQSPQELTKLGYTHGLSIDKRHFMFRTKGIYREQFYEHHKYELKDLDWNVVWMIRTKMMLLKYLYQVPQLIGYDVYTPFLDYELCMKMLNLPWAEKEDRKWQSEYLTKMGLNNKIPADYANMADLNALETMSPSPLNIDILKEYLDIGFLQEINTQLKKRPLLFKMGTNRLKNAFNYLIKWKYYDNKILKALNAYYLLIPLENLLKKVHGLED